MDNLSQTLVLYRRQSIKDNKRLNADIKRLEKICPGRLLTEKDNKDVVFYELKIIPNIPSRGVYNGLKIHKEEKLLIIFNVKSYPFQAPSILIDRLDFPAGQIPHLNLTPKGFPFSICLTKGNFHEWYLQNGVEALLDRIQYWFDDLVAGELIKEEDDFEFLRTDEIVTFLVLDEAFVEESLQKVYDHSRNQGHAYFKASIDNQITSHELFCTFQGWADTLESAMIPGIMYYPKKDYSSSNYLSNFPGSLQELPSFGKAYGLKISINDGWIKDNLGAKKNKPFLISLVIKRPRKIQGHNTNFEIISFVGFGPNHPTEDFRSKLFSISHRNPPTFKQARLISGNTPEDPFWDEKALVVGIGSLGSMVSHNLLKNGKNNLTFCDYDYLSPHNLIRWSSILGNAGSRKSQLLLDQAMKLYEFDYHRSFENFTTPVHKVTNLRSYSFIFDFTASYRALNFLSLTKNIKGKYFRGELFNQGSLGVLFKEGIDRTPRMDDLIVTLFSMSLNNQILSQWLRKEQDQRADRMANGEELIVGMGCSSDSIRLSSEKISLHAALMTSAIKENHGSKGPLIQISTLGSSIHELSIDQFTEIHVKPMIFWGKHEDWEIRFHNKTDELLMNLLFQYADDETGGILIGHLDRGRKVAYVTHVLSQPSDSKQGPMYFERGIKGVRSEIEHNYIKPSGGLITYLGEWHTHPKGGLKPSIKDLETVQKIRQYLDPAGIPTIMVIATPNRIYPYIYGESSFL